MRLSRERCSNQKFEDFSSELKNDRIKNTSKTAIVGFFSSILAVVGPFIIRTLMIKELGDEYAGLNADFVSLMSLLSISELGVSEVVVFFLYEPLSNGNIEEAQGYLNFFKRVYFYIGTFFFVIGGVVALFLPILTRNDIPSDVDLYVSYFLFLTGTCMHYFICPETIIIANALQRGYIVQMINLIGNFFVYIVEFIAIVLFHSFPLYFFFIFVQCIFVSLMRLYIKKHQYSFITPKGELSLNEKKRIKKRVLALIGHQMDDKFIMSIDTVIISSLLGLTYVTKYGNYMYVVTALSLVFMTFFNSMTASIGNAFVTESIDGIFLRFKAAFWLNGVIITWMCGCMICMYQSFMLIWMGKSRLLPDHTVVLFCLLFFALEIRRTVRIFKNASGMWNEDKYKPYASMIMNLFMDCILVHYIGIDGALISSIVCILFLEIPWESFVLYDKVFGRKPWRYFICIGEFLIMGVLVSGVSLLLINYMFRSISVITLVFRGILFTAIYMMVIILLFRKNEIFSIWMETIKIIIMKKAGGQRTI